METLLRRRAMLFNKSLPYDAEVEYLKSSGSQYIDAGVTGNENTKIEAAFAYGNVAGANLIGSRTTTTNGISLYIDYSANQRFGSTAILLSMSRNTQHIITIDKTSCVYDGTAQSVAYTGAFTTPTNLFVMRAGGQTTNFNGTFYYAKIWNDGKLVRDFIPVRVDTTGYLYDKVSKQLFGNAGTGAFELGNDKTT